MPVLNGKFSIQKKKVKLEISTELLDKINQYCSWAEINDISYFFEEAACFVFAKDKEWKLHIKPPRKYRKNKSQQAV